MTSSYISPKKPLSLCPEWATMQWLAKPIVAHLDALVIAVRRQGSPVRRNDVAAALILNQTAISPEGLWEIIQPYRAKFVPPRGKRLGGAIPVILLLPSPISLRLDGLVEEARKMSHAYRHDLLGALILSAPTEPNSLEAACQRYRQAAAENAVVPGQAKRRVLRLATPDPGPRPR
jgi:hypothetical protein